MCLCNPFRPSHKIASTQISVHKATSTRSAMDGDAQRDLEKKIQLEVTRREVFERKSAELERVNDQLRLENDDILSQLQATRLKLSDTKSKLEQAKKELKVLNSQNSQDGSQSSSSESEGEAAYVNLPAVVGRKVHTLKREKKALRQELEQSLGRNMSFKAAFQTEFDLRTEMEQKYDNLRLRFDRIVLENEQLRTVLQNHKIMVPPPPLPFDRAKYGPPKKPPPFSTKKRSLTFHPEQASYEDKINNSSHESSDSQESHDIPKDTQSKTKVKRRSQTIQFRQPIILLQNNDVERSISDQPVSVTSLATDETSPKLTSLQTKANTSDQEKQSSSENLPSEVASLHSSSHENVGDDSRHHDKVNAQSPSKLDPNLSPKTGRENSSQNQTEHSGTRSLANNGVIGNGSGCKESSNCCVSSSSSDELSDNDGVDEMEELVVAEGATTDDIDMEFLSIMVSTDKQLQSAKAFYKIVTEHLQSDSDS